MGLEGLHHVTCITGDAPANVDFYARLLGLRFVKKTVNFDAPDVYHLYYGDETGRPGSIMTFFEFPGARRGRAGAGQVHRLLWRVAGEDALDFWAERLAGEGVGARREDGGLRFADPEGLEHELVAADVPDPPLVARADGVAPEHALRGFHGVRIFDGAPHHSAEAFEALGFERADDDAWTVAGDERRAVLIVDRPPGHSALEGAGSVHHIAWNAADDRELEDLRDRAARSGMRPTGIIDRTYFHSVYFRVPSGVLFELATRDIGFTIDEPEATLGTELRLPPQHEHLRDHLERTLRPLPNPRAA